ncbi:cytochrome p450 monooxygenase [Colletotrichum karsti]|uniref:Cytochrome p450 monooxygenase n=1 Tax=Colletotrichum karsti TaxID=1095194 RepID=A0A9P6IFT2_9PEZI|nr:cytochrome p450 monooxygenase [Colletotrichum karsti]KAF9881632.1 cytochrome p450 monooxygenase [Colletotrichum karsti]
MSFVNSNQTTRFVEEAASIPRKYGFFVLGLGLSIWLVYSLYLKALPKPIKGMPHHPESTRRIMGDLPDLARTVARTKDLSGWLHGRAAEFNSPVCQIFLRPLSPPIVLLSDFREAQDLCMRRKEFDRGSMMRDLFTGPSPDHHITMVTGDEWKAHRRLLQDLMSPPFLQNVAAPAIYMNVVNLIKLWEEKARIAEGRPFSAYQDIFYTALDAVDAFSFGNDFPHNATKPIADLIRDLDDTEAAELRQGLSTDDPVDFPTVECDEVINAILDVSINIERLHASPFPVWKWRVIEKFPPLNKTMRVRREFLTRELNKAVSRQQSSGMDDTWMHSAVDLMVRREKKMAEEDGRAPNFLSPTMIDELFGVITGGHDTTSTTMLWGLKFLADNPEIQTKLRTAMEDGFSAARAEKRNLYIEEIMHTNVPYLYASMEEILRLAGTAPLVEREALRDTVLLGYQIPKGTKVFCLSLGASITSAAFKVDETKRNDTYHLSVKNRGEVPEWDPMDVAVFNPDRWLKPANSTEEKDQVNGDGPEVEFDSTSGPQIAFGLGKRSCFGKRLAYVELRILLSLIVWNFEIMKCPDALSGYEGRDGVTHKPLKNFVRLRKLVR